MKSLGNLFLINQAMQVQTDNVGSLFSFTSVIVTTLLTPTATKVGMPATFIKVMLTTIIHDFHNTIDGIITYSRMSLQCIFI